MESLPQNPEFSNKKKTWILKAVSHVTAYACFMDDYICSKYQYIAINIKRLKLKDKSRVTSMAILPHLLISAPLLRCLFMLQKMTSNFCNIAGKMCHSIIRPHTDKAFPSLKCLIS